MYVALRTVFALSKRNVLVTPVVFFSLLPDQKRKICTLYAFACRAFSYI